MFTKTLTLACLAAVNLVSAVTMPTISAVGSKFFFSNGTQYYIKGEPWLGHIVIDYPLM